MSINGVLLSIQDDIWKTNGGNVDAPRNLNAEEIDIIEQLSEILKSKMDTLDDKDLLTVIQMPLINTIPFVKLLIEHNNPTAMFLYSWMLQGGYEKYGVKINLEESNRFLDRAIDRAYEVSIKPDVAKILKKSKDINVFDYFIKGEAKVIDTIEKTVAGLCRKKGISENVADGVIMEMPIGPMMYMLAGGDGGGRYTGIIRQCSRQDDTFILNAECAGISSGAFKAAFEIFFHGNVEIEMKHI